MEAATKIGFKIIVLGVDSGGLKGRNYREFKNHHKNHAPPTIVSLHINI